ncbi:MAG: serine hydrolase domain-containing protein, partial [bacterium]
IRHGKVEFLEGFGMQDREAKLPMSPDTIFHIASLTKPITSVAALILVEEGRLDLDAPVAKYLPEFRDAKVLEPDGSGWKEVPPRRPMTIRHLFTHTAGLSYGWFGQDRVDQLMGERGVAKDNATMADFVGKLAKLPLKHHPGEVWEYSCATDVLGRVIEVVSGTTLDEFLRTRIFTPLGMPDTSFGVPARKRGRVAALYMVGKDGKAERSEDWWMAKDPAEKVAYFSGGGGLSCTAHDYGAFLQMLVSGGMSPGGRILQAKTVELMGTNQVAGVKLSERTPWIGDRGFGLGLTIYTAAGKRGVCRGWNGATGTIGWFNTEEDLAGVFLLHIGPHDYSNRFNELAHEALSGG